MPNPGSVTIYLGLSICYILEKMQFSAIYISVYASICQLAELQNFVVIDVGSISLGE